MLGLNKCLLWHMLAIVLVAMMLTIASSDARAAPDESTVHGVRLASPGVVRIIMSVRGKVICNSCATNGSTITFPLDGSSYQGVFSGSGAIISPDGYVLTADHVVDWQGPAVQSDFYNMAVEEYARTAKISVEEANNIFESFLEQNRFSIPTELISQRVFLTTTYTGNLQNVSRVMSFGVESIVVSSHHDKFGYSTLPAMLKDDVAIVKIGAHDLPYLTLASASTIHVQDSVTAVAFPGDADLGNFTELLDPTRSDVNTLNSLLTPTVETGQITAEKTFKNGTLYYEISEIAYYGSSGGPVINLQGQIVGFVDLSSSSDRVIFLIPSSIIASYTKQAGTTNQEKGAFMSLWTKAINEYDVTGPCHWTQAYQDLKKLHDTYAQFGGIQPFLKESQSKATPSECPAPAPPPSTPDWLIPTVVSRGMILLGIVVAFLVVFVFLRNKKAKLQPAATTTSMSADAMPAGMSIQSSLPDPNKQVGGMTASSSTGNALTYSQGLGSAFDHSTQPAIPVPATTSNISQLTPAADADQTLSAVYAGYPSPAPHLPIRKCLAGHVVNIDGAHFCTQCGAPIESRILQEQQI